MARKKVTAQSVLEKISQDHLECLVCKSRYISPKLLDCQHSFCFKCLQKLKEGHDPKKQRILCPLCRKETVLSEDGVAGLPHDFKLSSMVEEVTVQEKILKGQRSELKCQACDEGTQAVSRCLDCDHFLCQECQQAHQRLAVMRSHQVYTLPQLKSGEVTIKSKVLSKCKTHPDQGLSLYCDTCQKLICLQCGILVHVQPQHSLVDAQVALGKCKQEVAEMVAQVERNRAKHIAAVSDMEKSCKNLDAMFTETNKKISWRADTVVARVREGEQKLAKEAGQLHQGRTNMYKTAQTTNMQEVDREVSKLREVSRLMSQANQFEILHVKRKVIESLKKLAAKKPQKVSSNLSFMDFEKEENNLGRLVFVFEESPRLGRRHLKGTWALKRSLKTFWQENQTKTICCAYDVAAFSDNEIVLADIEHKALVVVFSDSKLNPKELQISGLKDPRRIAVNDDDQLIVIDHQVVKIFNRKYEFLSQFSPGRGFNSGLTCLDVDENNLIAVGYKSKKKGSGRISLHEPNGSVIRTLPAPGVGDFLLTRIQQITYWDGDMLQTMDYNGAAVCSMRIVGQPGQKCYPTGVCCNRDLNCYLAVRQNSGKIHQFTPGGKQTELVIGDCRHPYGITLTPAGDLVVAAEDSLQIFHLTQK